MKSLRLIASMLLLGLLSACVTMSQAPGYGVPLDERIKAYWAAREAGDEKTMYGMESAALPGGWLTPVVAAERGTGLSVSNAEIGKPAVQGDHAQVDVTAEVRVPAFRKPMRTTTTDKWIRIDGVWYHETQQ